MTENFPNPRDYVCFYPTIFTCLRQNENLGLGYVGWEKQSTWLGAGVNQLWSNMVLPVLSVVCIGRDIACSPCCLSPKLLPSDKSRLANYLAIVIVVHTLH
jgi:hypothetical protein